MSIGGPGGINMSNGPGGNSMSIGGPGGINYINYGGGGGDDWDVSGNSWNWPYGNSYNVNFGNQNNGWGMCNFYGTNFGNQNSPFGIINGPFGPGFSGPFNNNFSWGSIPQSQWPPHILAQYQRDMAEGAREMEEAAEEMRNMGMGMGMGPWGMTRGLKKKKKGKK
jgi:hypothetical protein